MAKSKKISLSVSKTDSLSPLSSAYELTRRVSALGFDWPNLSGVLNKLEEEMKEFREALGHQDKRKIAEELGDLLFVLVNVSRFLRIDPEKALKGTVKKFCTRFRYIEASLQKEKRSFHQSSLTEMDRWWEEAKRKKR